MNCNYECDGVGIPTDLENKIDYSTFNIYYSNQLILDFTEKVKSMFSKHFKLSLQEIQEELKINNVILLNVLSRMIEHIIRK